MSLPGAGYSSDPRSGFSSRPDAIERTSPADDLVKRWHQGQRVPAEAYLQRHPDLDEESAFEIVLTEAVLRQEYGEPAPLDEYLWRFPQFAERLRRHFALQATLEAGSSGSIHSHETLFATPGAKSPQLLPIIPGYEIAHEVGRGGMGVVYRARDTALGRDVALKFLPTDYANDPERLNRFVREARTASALNHPNICTVHALEYQEQQPFIVMEFVEGLTLQSMSAGGIDVKEVARFTRQTARALAAAHAAGVVHRDIKPENVMVRPDGYVKVMDFGLARQLPSIVGENSARSTNPGAILGTAAFMSPEQTRGESAESASDIFSLGIVLYQLAGGRHPFAAASALEMLHAISAQRPVSLSLINPAVPVALEALTSAMLEKDPRLRPSAVEVEATLTAVINSSGQAARTPVAPRTIVHRDTELLTLRTALDRAEAGSGSVVCLAGEPGIGKTTLVEDFLDAIADEGKNCLIARGHCSESQADTAAYLPVVDALEDLLRGQNSDSVARLMQFVAPIWYGQMATAYLLKTTHGSGSAKHVALPVVDDGKVIPSARASSQRAVLREFCKLLEQVSQLGPVVLFFDDVHWADASTVDLLAHLGRQCRNLRVLIVVTYRPTELLLGPHPFHRVKLELQSRDICTELTLGLLNCDDIRAYLSLAFPEHDFPLDFADLIHAATEGSPLFMSGLLRYLRERGVIAETGGRWSLAMELPDLHEYLPESIRSVIQRKLEMLHAEDRRLLAAASVQGCEFDSTVVAGALGLHAADIEERLVELDRVYGIVRLLREDELPDRTPTLHYSFVHVLYQQMLYTELQPSRRAGLASSLARSLAKHRPERTFVTVQLACLYELGRDHRLAAQSFLLAAQHAASVFAHRESIALARRGLGNLDFAMDAADDHSVELGLLTTLGMQLQVTQGFAAKDAKRAYIRARDLCRQAPESAPLFPVLWGLWLYSKVRSELSKAQDMADELLALAKQLRNPELAIKSYQALGMTAFCSGRPATAIQHVEQTAALYNPDRRESHLITVGQNPKDPSDPFVICKSFAAVSLWLLGFPDQARCQSESAITMSRRLSPSSQNIAMHFAAMVQQCCRNGSQARIYSDASMSIATEHGFSYWQAGASVLSGWALAATDSPEEGIEQLKRGLRDWIATDSVTYQTYYLGLLADVLRTSGRITEARRCVEEAIALVESTGERLYESELYRLQGELSLPDSCDLAEASFRRAIDVAQQQEAKSLELRAAMSLMRLSDSGPGRNRARLMLAEIYDWFTEGFDTPDLCDAREMLEEISPDARA